MGPPVPTSFLRPPATTVPISEICSSLSTPLYCEHPPDNHGCVDSSSCVVEFCGLLGIASLLSERSSLTAAFDPASTPTREPYYQRADLEKKSRIHGDGVCIHHDWRQNISYHQNRPHLRYRWCRLWRRLPQCQGRSLVD